MALVKTSDLGGKGGMARGPRAIAALPAPAPAAALAKTTTAQRRARDRSRARREKAAERIGAATEELASGIAEAAAAAEELRRGLDQISSAAEEAAGAALESQAAVDSLAAIFAQACNSAEHSRRGIDALQGLLTEGGARIETLVAAVRDNTARQLRAVDIAALLEGQAADIAEITRTVSDISDQTNLLALNAAIEASRAGEHGRGFAVVAEEVRAFAGISDRSARDVQKLAETIGGDVRAIAKRIKNAADLAQTDAANGLAIIASLGDIRGAMGGMSENSQATLIAVVEAETGAREARRGADQVARAAEEQSTAAAEAQRAVQQQSASLDQSHQTAQALAEMAESLRNGSGAGKSAEQVGAAAEELSATVQQLSGAAGEILAAIEQINRGAQQQAAATQQSTVAMAQIERAAISSRGAASQAVERADALAPMLSANRAAVAGLAEGVAAGLKEAEAVVALVAALESSGRRIEKIVDGIALVAVQTNMLAVTGAVEAARAGEFGRGFAVVSGDIRGLARDSADNANRVKDMVRLVGDHVAAVRQDLEQIVRAYRAEIGNNQAIVDRLRTVEADMAAIRVGSNEILAGSDTILQSVRQVVTGTLQIAAAAEETGGAASEAAAAAREQARGAEDLAASIEEIASLADELQLAES